MLSPSCVQIFITDNLVVGDQKLQNTYFVYTFLFIYNLWPGVEHGEAAF